MTPIEIKIDQINPWGDIGPDGFQEAETTWKIATLRHGTKEGRASVALRLDMPGGGIVIAQTTVRNFILAAAAIEAAHGRGGDL